MEYNRLTCQEEFNQKNDDAVITELLHCNMKLGSKLVQAQKKLHFILLNRFEKAFICNLFMWHSMFGNPNEEYSKCQKQHRYHLRFIQVFSLSHGGA